MAYKTADFVFFMRLSVIAAILLNEPWLNSVADFGKTFSYVSFARMHRLTLD